MVDLQSAPPARKTELQARLLSDHRALEELLAQLTCAIEGANWPALCEQWARFEQELREHVDAEERFLFPLVASAHRGDIEALRAEHQHIRRALTQLGMAVELHTLRKASVDELITYLQQHAARENHTLYQWLDESSVAERALRAMSDVRPRQTRVPSGQ